MEIYKDIVGYEGLYQISDYGNVKTLEKTRKGRNCLITKGEKLLKSNFVNHKYNFVRLITNGVYKNFFTHRLVAMTFIPNHENKK
jgi:hypothetical protein